MDIDGHIFISYARADGENYAERLEADLRRLGYAVWRDRTNLIQSQDYSVDLEIAIQQASYVVVCLTPSITEPKKDSFVRREISYAQGVPRPIIPLKFPNVRLPLPILIVNVHFIEFAEGTPPQEQLRYQEGLDRLIEIIKTGQQEARPAPIHDPLSDYLNSFYHYIVEYLSRTITHKEIVMVSRATQQAVSAPPDPLAKLIDAFNYRAGIDEDLAEYANFEQAFLHYGGRVLLLGTPGSGKTTTLLAFARDAITGWLSRLPDTRLPLVLPISTWQPDQHPTLTAWIEDVIPVFKQPDVPAVDDLIAQGQLLLILDGLDELLNRPGSAEDDARSRFMRLLPENNQIVVSCRIEDYYALGEKLRLKGAVTLQPLSDRQLRDYLKDLPDLWGWLSQDTELREMARTPLILNLLTTGYTQAKEEFVADLKSASPAQMLDHIIGFYVEQRYRLLGRRVGSLPFTLDEIDASLGQVAVQSLQKLYGVNLMSVEDISSTVLTNRVQEFIDYMIQLGLLVYRGDELLGFTHRLIQDYFYHHWAARLDDFTFATSYFEAFNWWGRYITFPFCESLITIWNQSHGASDTTGIGEMVTRFRAAYPPGSLVQKQATGDWPAVRVALQQLYTLFDLDGDPRLLDDDHRALRMATQEFMAETYRFSTPPDFDTAAAIYAESMAIYLEEDDLWNAAYQCAYLADLFVQAGRLDDAIRCAAQSQAIARDYARHSNEEDIKEILSLDAFALSRAYLDRDQVEQAGQAMTAALFWAFAQMVDPGPPDPYTRQWYADLGTNCAALILTFQARADRAALAELIESVCAFWPGMIARPLPLDLLLLITTPPVLAGALFPANAAEQDIGSAKSAFTGRAEPLIRAFYDAHPDLEIETPGGE